MVSLGSRPAIHGHVVGYSALWSAVLFLSVGCGVHYWQRHGAAFQDFERNNSGCVTEAKVLRLSVEPEQLYRACMWAGGWQRVQVGVPGPNQFRGPEDVEEFDRPPSPTAGQGSTHSDAATEAACWQPRVSRPAGIVCRPR